MSVDYLIVLKDPNGPFDFPLRSVIARARAFNHDVEYLEGDGEHPHVVDATGQPVARVIRHFTAKGTEFACEIVPLGGPV